MPHKLRSRRNLLPLTLLLGGLLGTGPFVPHTMAVATPAATAVPLDVPGLAGWLGLALAVVALAGVVIARREEEHTRQGAAGRRDHRDADDDVMRTVDPLMAALRGPAAYAPEDLDARLTASTSATAAHAIRSDSGPMWVRRIPVARPGSPAPEPTPDQTSDDRTADRLADATRV